MAQFRKKPVVIEAVQYLSDEATYNAIIEMGCPRIEKLAYWAIPTLEGDMKVSHGDYVIKGVKGEFYPCKADIFEMTYERVEANPSPGKDAKK